MVRHIETLAETIRAPGLTTSTVEAASLALIRTQVLPRWIGWVGLAGALGFVLGTFSVGNPGSPVEAFLLPGFVCFLVWMLATSIFMVRGRAALRAREAGLG